MAILHTFAVTGPGWPAPLQPIRSRVSLPYRGAAPAVADLLNGRIDLINTTLPSLVAHIRTGRLRALAYTSDKRHPVLSDISTSAESGVPGYKVASWFGITVPAQMPPEVIERLSTEIRKVVESDEFKRKVEEWGGIAAYKGQEDIKALIATEHEYWGKLIKSA
jgi:tripartite-type tricarboxylate transporter receptor subunit TctC